MAQKVYGHLRGTIQECGYAVCIMIVMLYERDNSS